MIRFLFRALAIFTLATAVVMGVLDATRSVAAGKLVTTPLITSWEATFPASFASFRTFIITRLDEFFWNPVTVAVLELPGFAVLTVLALLFYWIGRRREPPREDWA